MRVKSGLAEMLKGGVIMDVTDADQARIAEEAGAVAVMALERVPADIRARGRRRPDGRPGQDHRDSGGRDDPRDGQGAHRPFRRGADSRGARGRLHRRVAKSSPRPTTAHHIDKWRFTVPFVCGCTNIGEALRRIAEGAAMIRTKGEAGTGDIVNAVTHMRSVFGAIKRLGAMRSGRALQSRRRTCSAPVELVQAGSPRTEAAGRHVHRRRDRDPCRCGALHAARRGRRLRRLRDLQVRRTRASGRRRSSRRRRISATPRCSRGFRAAWARR